MLLVSPILQIVSAPVLVRSTNSLIALLRDTIAQRPASTATKAQQKQDQLLRTLTNFRNQNLSSMASYLLTTPVLAIVYLCLGAMPFMWVITFFLVIVRACFPTNGADAASIAEHRRRRCAAAAASATPKGTDTTRTRAHARAQCKQPTFTCS